VGLFAAKAVRSVVNGNFNDGTDHDITEAVEQREEQVLRVPTSVGLFLVLLERKLNARLKAVL
jgi:hypothetical protein